MTLPKPADSSLIRRTFLSFFAERGHEIVPSAPLIPQNDPTLMFVNAGMVPFKDVFTGKETRAYKRATSSQKCIRISGKHNDLENVGVTARHQTFFEMLGNFSFGDYFKEDAIVFAWDLLTRVYGIPKERLVITVYNGEGGFPADDEAAAIWRKVTGFGDERILGLGLADNFWTMGDTGPCGPCSEIHFFHGGKPDLARFGEEPRADGSGWTEIWNNVFMQFDRAEKDGPVTALPAPSIDTGMGLERIASVIQGVKSNYDTDLLRGLVDKAAELAHKPYRGGSSDDDVSMRVIADHARTTAFLLASGVMPEKQKREYVLRRVMRRAIRHGHRLGIDKPFLHEVAGEVIRTMGEAYPELQERRELIVRVTEDEEVRFRATLKRGMKILEERFGAMEKAGETTLPAAAAADLYTTYGFPLDLTQVICREANFAVDLDGAEAIVHGAAEATGPIDPGANVDRAYRELRTRTETSTFSGYDHEEGVSRVLGVLRVERSGEKKQRALVDSAGVGAEVEIVVAETPFYAESGGQVGDIGRMMSADGLEVDISDTQRPLPNLVVHVGTVRAGVLRLGDEVQLVVDHAARSATRRNHSATHLLHWALRQVLGEHAQQKGSRVGPDVLRFDFAHNRPVSRDELQRIEDLVNAKILTNAPVVTEVLPQEEARRRGAMAIFEEKYGDVVRVLTMTSDSIELCGGTHARALGDIGLFKTVSEGGVAAGVRRLFAVTGLNALLYMRQVESELDGARRIVKAQGGDLIDKLGKLVQHERELEKKIGELERRLLEGPAAGGGASGVDAMLDEARAVAGLRVLARRVADGTNAGALRELAEKLRDKLGDDAVVLLGAVAADKAQLVVMVSKAATSKVKAGDLVKAVAAMVGGSGGGRADMAQAGGTEIGKLDAAIASTYGEVERLTGRG
jgi:alanyl-tRNA synthetase